MSKQSFNSLNAKQQKALMKAGKIAEKFMTNAVSKLDSDMEKAYKSAGVKIVYMTKADHAAWVDLAKKSSFAEFVKKVPTGQKLIDQALAVK